MVEFAPWWHVYVKGKDETTAAPHISNVETQNIESGGFHLVDLHLPINMDGGMVWLFLALAVGLAAYFYRRKTKRHAHKRVYRQGGGNMDDFNEYYKWIQEGRPTAQNQPAHSNQPNAQPLAVESLIPLIQALNRPALPAPAPVHASPTRLQTTADVHSSHTPPRSPMPARHLSSPLPSPCSLADPVCRRENWHNIA